MEKDLRTQFIDFMTLNRYLPFTMQNYIGTLKQLMLSSPWSKNLPEIYRGLKVRLYLWAALI